MFTFTALYADPDDREGFLAHYRTHHLEICRRWPGLQSATVTEYAGTPRGTDPPYVLQGVFSFASRDDFMAAMQTESGGESQRDARQMAERFGVSATMLLGETDAVA